MYISISNGQIITDSINLCKYKGSSLEQLKENFSCCVKIIVKCDSYTHHPDESNF